jgi:hypothetical protein
LEGIARARAAASLFVSSSIAATILPHIHVYHNHSIPFRHINRSAGSAAHKSNPIKQITKQINQISRKSYFKQTNPKSWI